MTSDILSGNIPVQIDRLIAGGRGIAFVDGVPVFVAGAAPGDVVRLCVTKSHRSYHEADIAEIITPSPARVVPRCAVFGQCGGCQWQHLDYVTQLVAKQQIVQEQLRRIARLEIAVLPTIASPSPWNYRSRIQLQVDAGGRVGFFRTGSHAVVEFARCEISEERINAQLVELKQQARAGGAGRQAVQDESSGFSQINPPQNEVLRALVADGVVQYGGGSVLELYCGSGNLTFAIAPHATQVIAADDDKGAIAAAQHEAATQKISHVQFVCISAEKILQHPAQKKSRIDCIVLDPPRRGAAESVPGIIALHPRAMCYISCDPATLARDLRLLIAAGYIVESVQPIDMFPQTFHIETVVWCRRN